MPRSILLTVGLPTLLALCFFIQPAAGQKPSAALIVVDMQTDFLGNEWFIPEQEAGPLLENAAQVVQLFQEKGLPVYFTQASQKKLHLSPEGEKTITDDFSEIHPSIKLAGAPVFRKQQANALLQSALRRQLADQGVEELVVIGLLVEDCLSKTAIGGTALGYRIFTVEEALGYKEAKARDKSFRKMEKKGVAFPTMKELTDHLQK